MNHKEHEGHQVGAEAQLFVCFVSFVVPILPAPYERRQASLGPRFRGDGRM
jgi:hypothetical protein